MITGTNQELFDIMYTGLVSQGCGSIGADGNCLYRGPNGTKCAVGMLMQDDEYSQDCEDNPVTLLPAELIGQYPTNQWDLLLDMQHAHDSAAIASLNYKDSNFVERFEERATSVARKYNLTVPTV